MAKGKERTATEAEFKGKQQATHIPKITVRLSLLLDAFVRVDLHYLHILGRQALFALFLPCSLSLLRSVMSA